MVCFFLGKTANRKCSCNKKSQKRPIFTPTSGGMFNWEGQEWCGIILSLLTPPNSSPHLHHFPITGLQAMCLYLEPTLATGAHWLPRSVLWATLMEIARSVSGSRDIFSA